MVDRTVLLGALLVGFVIGAIPESSLGEDASGSHGLGPDLISGEITSVTRWGRVGDLTAYSLGMVACNAGDEEVLWQGVTRHHPVAAQNLYRLSEGRFEQIGQSWVLHAVFALQGGTCFTDCDPSNGTTLGTHCSTTNSATTSGTQSRLGPRHEIDASTGFVLFPYSQPPADPTIGRRLQVRDADLDPTLNPESIYLAEIHFVSEDDALAANKNNNASWRRVSVTGSSPTFSLQVQDETRCEEPALTAWRELDPTVEVTEVEVPGDGSIVLGCKITAIGEKYEYEYAVFNMNSHRSVRGFSVPLLGTASLTTVGFHDIDYHSGEPFDGTDWTGTREGESLGWSTDRFEDDPLANALRWGTLYNFRFVTDSPPVAGQARLSLFRPGTPDEIEIEAKVPMNSRSGNVNAAAEGISDVVLVNGSSGGGGRRVALDSTSPLKIVVESPPAGPGRFVLYAWSIDPGTDPGKLDPFGIGATALPTPLSPACSPQPVRIANGLGFESLLGIDNWPGPPPGSAPSVF